MFRLVGFVLYLFLRLFLWIDSQDVIWEFVFGVVWCVGCLVVGVGGARFLFDVCYFDT